MKSLTGAMESMTETRHAFQLIYNELLEEQVDIFNISGLRRLGSVIVVTSAL